MAKKSPKPNSLSVFFETTISGELPMKTGPVPGPTEFWEVAYIFLVVQWAHLSNESSRPEDGTLLGQN